MKRPFSNAITENPSSFKKKLTAKDVMVMEATNDDDKVLAAIWRHWESSLRRVGGWTSATAFAASLNIVRDATTHKVTSINLPNFELKGTIPSEIGALSSLQELFLSDNQLTSIPAELGTLSSLRELHLDHNPLASIPTELGALSSLQRLYLSQNQHQLACTLPVSRRDGEGGGGFLYFA